MSSQDPVQQQQQQRIPNPRRLLILSPSSHSPTTIPPFLLALTGSPVLDPPSTSATSSASTSPDQPPTSFAGYTTHPPLQIRNRYYVAEVPVWVDEIALAGCKPEAEAGPEPITTPSVWKTEFSGPDAKVVRDAIGAVVVCIVNPTLTPSPSPAPNLNLDLDSPTESTGTEPSRTRTESGPGLETHSLKDFLRAVGEVRALIEEERGGTGDVPGLVVLVDQGGQTAVQKSGQGQSGTEGIDTLGEDDLDAGVDADEPFSIPWWEDQLYDMGLIGMEVVRWDAKGGKEAETEERNQFGEYQGMRRIREVLETHDWAPSSDPAEEDADGETDEIEKMLLGGDEDTGFGLEVNELEREMAGLRFAIERGGSREEDSQEEGDEELRVDAVEALMLRMAAIRDMSDELPEHERKRFAAKAVRDIMKEI